MRLHKVDLTTGVKFRCNLCVISLNLNFIVLNKLLPACRRLLFPLLHAEKGRLRNAVANRVPASLWQEGTLFRINYEIISG